MSNYTQVTDFSDKDALTTGDPEKAISGADVDGELSLIATAVNSKQNSLGNGSAGQHLSTTGSAAEWQSGGWQLIGTYAASTDALIEVFGDGIEGAASAAFLDNYTYKIVYEHVQGDTVSESLRFQLFEGGVYQASSGDYFNQWHGINGLSEDSSANGTELNGVMSAAIWTTAATDIRGVVHGSMEFSNLASTDRQSTWAGYGWGSTDSVNLGYNNSGWRYEEVTPVASTKLKIITSGGNNIVIGTFRLYRRRDS